MSFFGSIAASSKSKFLAIDTPVNTSPIRILIIGDSIANGTNEIYQQPDTDDSVQGIANTDTLYEWNGSNLIDLAGGDTIGANNGSQYPSMANKLKELTGRVVHIVETATGGDGIARYTQNNWTATGNRYAPMLTKANSYLSNQEVSKFDIIKIIAGYNDGGSSYDEAIFNEDLASLITRLTADFPNTKIVYSSLYSGKSAARDKIRVSIQNLINNNSSVYAGEDLENWKSATHLFDGIHLNQAANDSFGEADAAIIANYL
jgi:hypothetical protein